MKLKKIWLILVPLVLIMAILVALRWPKTDQNLEEPATRESERASDQLPKRSITEEMGSTIVAVTTSPPFRAAGAIEDFARKQELATREWRASIDFYGKVVDEVGNPVADARVSFSWNNLSGTQNSSTESDASGLFELIGERGKFLSVKVNKEGYYAYKPHGEGFFFAGENENFVPDANDPVVFRLHKGHAAEALVHTASRHKVPLQGQPVRIDLHTGKSESAGELVLTCVSDYTNRSAERTFDWHLAVAVPGGGIVESTKEFDFEAPETGYQPSIEIDMPATLAEGWQEVVEKKFFLILANRNYARITFRFYSYNGVLRLESYVNPSGSRNLEFDPSQVIHPAR